MVMAFWHDIVGFQQTIYQAFALQIRGFESGGGWSALLLYLPMGILFGAAHALTPGHSKTVLASYLAGSRLGLLRGFSVSLVLSLTHVSLAVVIALLALPLVSATLGRVGRAPVLEDVSRALLLGIGVWMIWRAQRRRTHSHSHGEGLMVGVMAGLIPCPLTLFVMTLAMARGVPEAGIAFAVAMMIGVALTLSAVAAATVLCRDRLLFLIERRAAMLDRSARLLEGAAGLLLLAVAIKELWLR